MFETGETITDGETCCKDVGQASSSKRQSTGTGELGKASDLSIESLVHRIEALEGKIEELLQTPKVTTTRVRTLPPY